MDVVYRVVRDGLTACFVSVIVYRCVMRDASKCCEHDKAKEKDISIIQSLVLYIFLTVIDPLSPLAAITIRCGWNASDRVNAFL